MKGKKRNPKYKNIIKKYSNETPCEEALYKMIFLYIKSGLTGKV
ncbi:MAG: hypothetical protein N3I35_16915 [Clostridia bacterium]|nr:hypothetical protein [Clostridia bacterium]